jgi:hypothetical protein
LPSNATYPPTLLASYVWHRPDSCNALSEQFCLSCGVLLICSRLSRGTIGSHAGRFFVKFDVASPWPSQTQFFPSSTLARRPSPSHRPSYVERGSAQSFLGLRSCPSLDPPRNSLVYVTLRGWHHSSPLIRRPFAGHLFAQTSEGKALFFRPLRSLPIPCSLNARSVFIQSFSIAQQKTVR